MNTTLAALTPPQPLPESWVVFTGQTDLPWLRLLRRGFRHCFVILNDGTHWLTVDPLSNYTDIHVCHVPAEFDLPLWLADRGLKVLPVRMQRPARPAPWMPFTCVEAVKRLLGIHRRWLITPWQLYRYLAQAQACAATNPSHPQGDLAWEV